MSGIFGKAKFGGKGRNWFKLKDGSNGPYRILPPMGYLGEDGRWSAFYSIHYGYKNSEGKMRTFQSSLIKNRKTKMIESPDPALDFINKLKVKLDEAKKAGNNELVAKITELVGGKKSRYNLDNNHYLNVIDLQGNIGILKIRHRCKLALDAEIKKLRDNSIEPLDPETGRFFTFHRSGMGMETVYSVSIYKQKLHIDGVGEVEKDVTHAITDDIARRCCVLKGTDAKGNPVYEYKEAANLGNLFAKPTAQEIERIVNEGSKAVDEILDSKTETAESDDGGPEEDEAVTTASGTVATAPIVTTATTADTRTPDAAALAAAVVAAGIAPQPAAVATPAPVAQAPAPVVAQAPVVQAPVSQPPVSQGSNTGVPKTTAQRTSELSDAEFLAMLKL